MVSGFSDLRKKVLERAGSGEGSGVARKSVRVSRGSV